MIIGFLLGCQNSSRPSFVLIAADQLSFQDTNCSRDWHDQESGIGLLCRESVRWTHAYTTSILSGPALGSILTGLHPLESGYRHHAQNLSSKHRNVAQLALQANYRTAFFSGGPPVLRKTGLAAGFEVFDDSLNLAENPFLKPFRKTIFAFREWRDEIGSHPFFAVFYAPDLRYINRITRVASGETRSQTFESQLEEFDLSLHELFMFLKKEGLWDRTHILLLGLQGRNLYDRQTLFPHLNLHSENSQITVLWKPAQIKRDAPVTWTMDKNISLSDIGRTLFDLFGAPPPQGKLETSSLSVSLSQPSSRISSGRMILIESAWSQWLMKTTPATALIRDEELYLHNQNGSLFRTLSDRLEINPNQKNDLNRHLFEDFERAAEELNLARFHTTKIEPASIWNLNDQAWRQPKLQGLLELYSPYSPQEIPVGERPWYARALIENGRWKELKAVAEKWKKGKWLWLAQAHLGLTSGRDEDPCLRLVKDDRRSAEMMKNCSDSQFVEALMSLEKDRRNKRWERILEERLMLAQILKMNRAQGFLWDVPEKEDDILSLTEILFWAPENRALLRASQKKVQSSEFDSL